MSTLKFNTWQNTVGTRTYAPIHTWVHFNASSGTPTIQASLNVSSITDNGLGDFTINYATVLANANYAISLGCQSSSGPPLRMVVEWAATARSTSLIRVRCAEPHTGNSVDENNIVAILTGGI